MSGQQFRLTLYCSSRYHLENIFSRVKHVFAWQMKMDFLILSATYFVKHKSSLPHVMEQLKISVSFCFSGEVTGGYFLLKFGLTERALKQ